MWGGGGYSDCHGEILAPREIVGNKEKQWRRVMLLELYRKIGGLEHVCGCVCVHACRGYSGAMGSIVKRTIGVKLG